MLRWPWPEVHLGEERVHAEPGDEGEPPAPVHRLDRVAHEVVEDLEDPVLVGQDGRQARIVAPEDLHAALARHLLGEEGHALEQLVDVERDRAQRHRAADVEQHLDDAVDPVDLLEQHVGVLAEARVVAQLAPHELHRPADRPERDCGSRGPGPSRSARPRPASPRGAPRTRAGAGGSCRGSPPPPPRRRRSARAGR